jgi:hypothetical protein
MTIIPDKIFIVFSPDGILVSVHDTIEAAANDLGTRQMIGIYKRTHMLRGIVDDDNKPKKRLEGRIACQDGD